MNPPLPSTSSIEQVAADRKHLRLLEICNYGIGSCVFLVGLWPLYWAAGLVKTDPRDYGYAYIFGGAALALSLIVLSAAMACFHAGRSLRKRREMGFCQALAGIYCLLIPIGTALGVFTFLVLKRPSVKALFQSPPP